MLIFYYAGAWITICVVAPSHVGVVVSSYGECVAQAQSYLWIALKACIQFAAATFFIYLLIFLHLLCFRFPFCCASFSFLLFKIKDPLIMIANALVYLSCLALFLFTSYVYLLFCVEKLRKIV